MPDDHRTVYSTVEFSNWSDRSGLIQAEEALIQEFLSPDAATVEAGTGGGRILFELRRQGYTKLWGYDCVPDMIARAQQRDGTRTIRFSVMNAERLEYESACFDQAIYLQQVLSFIESENDRRSAILEMFRVLKDGGIGLVSVCCYEVRMSSWAYRLIVGWLQLVRRVRGVRLCSQNMPWLKHGRGINWGLFLDRSPHVYWFRASEAESVFLEAGFEILAVGSAIQVEAGDMQKSVRDLGDRPLQGHLYFVCRKPAVEMPGSSAGSQQDCVIAGARP